jgi:hypothetical protein
MSLTTWSSSLNWSPKVEQWLDSLTFGDYQRALYKGDLARLT